VLKQPNSVATAAETPMNSLTAEPDQPYSGGRQPRKSTAAASPPKDRAAAAG